MVLRYSLAARIVVGTILALTSFAFAEENRDPNVHGGGKDFRNNPEVLSPIILRRPIYECADTVVVNGYVPLAKIEVYLAGNPSPIGSATASEIANQPVKVSAAFVKGQVVTAIQVVGGVKSNSSNSVTVTSYKDDYPAGLPQPRLAPTPSRSMP